MYSALGFTPAGLVPFNNFESEDAEFIYRVEQDQYI